LWTTLVKSLSETHPDFGFASEPVDVQRYVDGSVHVAWPLEVAELELAGLELAGLVVGGFELLDEFPLDGAELLVEAAEPPAVPLQLVPFSAKLVGAGFEPFQVPLNPKAALPLVGRLPL
jgi:hypothetical protein